MTRLVGWVVSNGTYVQQKAERRELGEFYSRDTDRAACSYFRTLSTKHETNATAVFTYSTGGGQAVSKCHDSFCRQLDWFEFVRRELNFPRRGNKNLTFIIQPSRVETCFHFSFKSVNVYFVTHRQGRTSALPEFGFAPSLPYRPKDERKFKFQVFLYLLCFYFFFMCITTPII